jgi:hypothetical protein
MDKEEQDSLLASHYRIMAQLEHATQLANESETIGQQTIIELDRQKDHIVRIGGKVANVHRGIEKARSILQRMSNQITTNRCLQALIVLVLVGILILVIFLKVH